jgi:hypothetical protein
MSDIVKSLDLAVRRFSKRSSPCILEGGSGAVDRFPLARSSVLPSPKARPPKFRGFFFGASSRRAAIQRVSLSHVTSGRNPSGSVHGSRKARCNSYSPWDWLHSQVWGPRERHGNPRKGLDIPLFFKFTAWGRGRLLAGFPTA